MLERKALTANELAQYLGIGRNRAYQLTRTQGFPAVRISQRRIIIPVRELEKWLEEQAMNESR